MGHWISHIEAYSRLVLDVNKAMSDLLRKLLEQHHIYQSVSVEMDPVFEDWRKRVDPEGMSRFKMLAEELATEARLSPSTEQLFTEERDGNRIPIASVVLQNIKLGCSTCARREAFRPYWWTDVMNELSKLRDRDSIGVRSFRRTSQYYLFLYQCQGCERLPDAFLVRRNGWKLSLEGRSPMEHVDVPTFLPKKERWLYRDSLIAMHGGKTLAALFYLRSFIEQYARRQTQSSGKRTGDEIMSAYLENIPVDLRDRMPSLGSLYDRLSEAIHAATEDPALYRESRLEVEKHFDIRRVFKLPEF